MIKIQIYTMLGLMLAFYGYCFLIYEWRQFIELFILTILTGSFGYIYFLSSSNLNKKTFSALEILAVRFWPLFILSFSFVIFTQEYHNIDVKLISTSLWVSLTSLIIPIFFAQKSIETVGYNKHAILIGVAPCLTFLLEKFTLNINDNTMIYFSVILFITVFLPKIIKVKNRILDLS